MVWDLPAGTRRGAIPIDGFRWGESSNNLTMSADGRTLLVARRLPRPGNVIDIWDLDTVKHLGKVPLDDAAAPVLTG